MVEGRSCGSCRMCCKIPAIWEDGTGDDGRPYTFKKPARQWCEHASSQGCAIHHSPAKPLSCRTFYCKWLLGWGREEDRPDRSRVLLYDDRLWPGGPIALVLHECRDGASGRRSIQSLAEEIVQKDVFSSVICTIPGGVGQGRTLRWVSGPRKGQTEKLPPEDLTVTLPDGPFDADSERAILVRALGAEACRRPTISPKLLYHAAKAASETEREELARSFGIKLVDDPAMPSEMRDADSSRSGDSGKD